MTIYSDRIYAGYWFHCANCRRSGDMLQLLAEAENCSLQDTITQLASRGLLDTPATAADAAAYLQTVVAFRRRFLALWQRARQRPIHGSTTIPRLVHSLRLHCDVSPSRYAEGPGRLFGSLTAREIVQAFRATTSRPNYDNGKNRIFRGEGWDEVLVFPLRDLPLRLSGFVFIGREGREPQDIVLRNLVPTSRSLTSAGLYLHPAALESAADWGHVLVLTTELVRVAQLQCRHFEESLRPLPLAAWLPSQPDNRQHLGHNAWQWLYEQRLVFWMPRPSAGALEQAIVHDSRVSTAGPAAHQDEQAWHNYRQRQSPRDLLQHIVQTAKPWPAILDEVFAKLSRNEMRQLLGELASRRVDLNAVWRRCGKLLRQQLSQLTRKEICSRSVHLGQLQVFEQRDGWYLRRGEQSRERIVNAVLRIEEVVRVSRGRTFYRGYIRFRGHKYPFCEDSRIVEKNTFKWMKTLLAEHGHWLDYLPSRSGQAVLLATRFHEPQIVDEPDCVGWDPPRQRLVLPAWSVRSGGQVTTSPMLIREALPGLAIPPPAPLSGLEFDLCLTGQTGELTVWAGLLAAMSAVLAPAYGGTPAGVALRDRGAHAAGRSLAAVLGCLAYTFDGTKDATKFQALEMSHGWPSLVQLSEARAVRGQRWLQLRTHNCLALLDWWPATYNLLQGHWHTVTAAESAVLDESQIAALRQVFTGYLQHVARRHFHSNCTDLRPGPQLLQLVDDFVEFARQYTPEADRLRQVGSLLQPANDAGYAAAFADMLSALLVAGRATLGREGYPGRGESVLLRTSQGLFVSRDWCLRQLRKHRVAGDAQVIEQVLRTAGVLRDSDDRGWFLQEQWWFEHHRQTKAATGPQLRVVS